jgi:hypothetical protein
MTAIAILAAIRAAIEVVPGLADVFNRLAKGQEPTPEDHALLDHALELSGNRYDDAAERYRQRHGLPPKNPLAGTTPPPPQLDTLTQPPPPEMPQE